MKHKKFRDRSLFYATVKDKEVATSTTMRRQHGRNTIPVSCLFCSLIAVFNHCQWPLHQASCFVTQNIGFSISTTRRTSLHNLSKKNRHHHNHNKRRRVLYEQQTKQSTTAAAATSDEPTTHLARRHFFNNVIWSCVVPTVVGTTAIQEEATAEYYSGSPAMVKEWPDIKFLVPIYEFEKALGYLEQQINSQTSKGLIKALEIVENFLKGGLASNKNLFKLLCAGYIGGIIYDDPDKELIRDEQRRLLDATDAVADNIAAMRDPLKELVDAGATKPSSEVLQLINESRRNMTIFFDRIPKQDIEAIDQWIVALQKADINHNGIIESNELDTLNENYQQLYKEVGDFLST